MKPLECLVLLSRQGSRVGPAQKELNFDHVYSHLIRRAIEDANETLLSEEIRVQYSRREELILAGNVVSKLIQRRCECHIVVFNISTLDADVLFEYGIRAAIRDPLNILMCHSDVVLPRDLQGQACIRYSLEIPDAETAKIQLSRTLA